MRHRVLASARATNAKWHLGAQRPALRVSYFWIYLAYPIGAILGLMQLIGAYFAPRLADSVNDGAEETA